MLKVLLTQPLFTSKQLLGIFNPGANANTFLYGQASLAAVAREAGHDVTILDPYHDKTSPEEYIAFLRDHQFDVIGCTVFTLTFPLAKKLFEYTRTALPHACIIAGGPHPTGLPEPTLEESKELDVVVYGEGENTFVELLEKVQNNDKLDSVTGIAYRDNGKVSLNSPRELIQNMDDLPRPAYDLFPIKDYVPTPNLVKRYPTVAIQVTRGCPYKCAFCQFNLTLGKKYRHFSPNIIVDELSYLKNNFNARGIIFRDSTLTVNISFLQDLCQAMIDSKLNLKWMCYSRTDIIAKHYKTILPLMKKAGCWQIGYGCESANQKSLDLINKGTTVEDNITAVTETIKAGIMCSTTWILCLPGETSEDSRRTIALANQLSSHVAKFFLPVPFPNTEMEKICLRHGGLREDARCDDYDLIMPESPVYVNPLIGAKEMRKILKRAYLKFYTNPKVIFRNLRTVSDWDTVKKYWAFLKMIF